MGGVLREQTEVSPGSSLDTLGQPIEAPPESRGGAVHLQIFERAMFAGVKGLSDEEVERSGLRFGFETTIPALPV